MTQKQYLLVTTGLCFGCCTALLLDAQLETQPITDIQKFRRVRYGSALFFAGVGVTCLFFAGKK